MPAFEVFVELFASLELAVNITFISVWHEEVNRFLDVAVEPDVSDEVSDVAADFEQEVVPRIG